MDDQGYAAEFVDSAMVRLRRCREAPGLGSWLRQALDRYHPIDNGPLVATPLATMLQEIPVLLDPSRTDCVWSGRIGAVVCWELQDEAGRVVARAATAPRTDLRIPQEIVRNHPYAYHQSAIGAGPGFLEEHPFSYDEKLIRNGPHFDGYIRGDDLVGCLNVGPGARLLLFVAEFPGASIADHDGYWDGEALLARLHISAT
jgi:hypothetical protein